MCGTKGNSNFSLDSSCNPYLHLLTSYDSCKMIAGDPGIILDHLDTTELQGLEVWLPCAHTTPPLILQALADTGRVEPGCDFLPDWSGSALPGRTWIACLGTPRLLAWPRDMRKGENMKTRSQDFTRDART